MLGSSMLNKECSEVGQFIYVVHSLQEVVFSLCIQDARRMNPSFISSVIHLLILNLHH